MLPPSTWAWDGISPRRLDGVLPQVGQTSYAGGKNDINFNILIFSETDLTIDAIAANTELTPCIDVRTGIGMEIEFSKKKWLPNPLDFLGNVDLQ